MKVKPVRGEGARSSPGWRGLFFRGLAAVLGVIAALLVAEIGFRLREAIIGWSHLAQLDRVDTSLPPPFAGDCRAPEQQAELGELIRLSPDRGVIYQLKPSLDTCYYGVRVRTNEDGLRGPARFERPKPPDVRRLLFLGDSQTFGQGVEYRETFVALIEERLNRLARGTRVEAINSGVDGYNTAQEAALLRAEGMTYEPDCIAVLYIANDFELPRFLRDPRSGLGSSRSFVARAIAERVDLGSSRAPQGLLHAKEDDRLPKEYRRMTGVSGYRAALSSIAETAAPSAIPVLNFADYPAGGAGRELRRYGRSLGIRMPPFEFPVDRRYQLADDNHHLNPAGHAIVAERMLRGVLRYRRCAGALLGAADSRRPDSPAGLAGEGARRPESGVTIGLD